MPARPRQISPFPTIAFVVGAVLLAAPGLFAQQGPRFQPRNASIPATMGRAVPPVAIEVSAPIANLFARAEEGIARADWKFAIDSLQRIIDDPDGGLMRDEADCEDGVSVYESARTRALRLLATLPPEALRIYRLLYDGKARGLLDRAAASHDASGLRVVVARYLLTRSGDDAADLLASWAIDEGRPAEAVSCLQQVLEYVRDRDVPDSRIYSKLAVAKVLLGRPEEGALFAKSFKTRSTGEQDHHESLDHTLRILGDRFASGSRESFGGMSWPVIGGSTSRLGNMNQASPSLIDPAPWHFVLPGMPRGIWDRVYRDNFRLIPELPTSQLVADGGRLYVRMPGGVAALDMNDLRPIWTSWSNDVDAASALDHHQRERMSMAAEAVFEDYVVGSISVAHGLVLAIERGPHGLERDAQKANRSRRRRARPISLDRPTRVVAFDAVTGDIRWSRGRQVVGDDPLGRVEFRAPLIGVGDELWGVYFLGDGLYAAVIDPADGALIQSILLGSVADPLTNRAHTLHLASEAGLVFVPSDHGVLFAIDARDRTIRWASQYLPDQVPGAPADLRDVERWLPSPPIATNGLVLLTPADRRELLAFDAVDGQLVWSTIADDVGYLIGADHRRVWLGGRKISCLSLVDGQQIWATEVSSRPTGRAVLSGDTIHVPVSAGLVSLDAEDGRETAARDLPAPAVPLGNILCLGPAMYSYDQSGVRKFPDLDRMYAEVLDQHERDRSDAAVTIRLARLELLRDNPERALDVTAALGDARVLADPVSAKALSHVNIDALLRVVGYAEKADATTLALVDRARSQAQTSSDRVRCSLARAELLERMGRVADAFKEYLALYLNVDAGLGRRLGDYVTGQPRVAIGTRLETLVGRLDDGEMKGIRDSLDATVRAKVAGLASGGDALAAIRDLHAIAELPVMPSAARQATRELVDWQSGQRRFESSEYLLRGAARHQAPVAEGAAALLDLCRFYEEQQPRATEYLVHCLADLDRRYGLLPVPPQFDGWQQAVGLKVGGGAGTIAEWTRACWGRVAEQLFTPTGQARAAGYGRILGDPVSPRKIGLPTKAAWSLVPIMSTRDKVAASFALPKEMMDALQGAPTFGPPRVCRFGRDVEKVLDDRVVFFGPGDMIYCQRASDGEVLWHTRLTQSESFKTDTAGSAKEPKSTARRVAAEGQIAVFNGSEGLMAVGLLTGKRLWARPYDTLGSPQKRARADTAMDAKDGYLAALPNAGRLSLLRLDNGDTIWERELRGETVETVRMVGPYVLAMDRSHQRVHLFDRKDGTLMHQTFFRQPNPSNERVEIVETDGVLFGPQHSAHVDAVIAVDLATGKQRWRKVLDKPLVQLFVPAEGYLGVCLLGGGLQIWDAKQGEILIDQRIAAATKIIDGVLFDGTLLVRYLHQQQGGARPGLVAIDIATGNEVWVRDDLAPDPNATRRIRLVEGCIPTLIEKRGGQARKHMITYLALVDARTGEDVSKPVPIKPGSPRFTLNGDFHVWSGGVVIGAREKIAAFNFQPRTADQAGGS